MGNQRGFPSHKGKETKCCPCLLGLPKFRCDHSASNWHTGPTAQFQGCGRVLIPSRGGKRLLSVFLQPLECHSQVNFTVRPSHLRGLFVPQMRIPQFHCEKQKHCCSCSSHIDACWLPLCIYSTFHFSPLLSENYNAQRQSRNFSVEITTS